MENNYFNQAQQQYFQDCREIELVKAKEVAKNAVRLEAQTLREERKEAEKERKRAIFQEIEILESGEIGVITRNLRIEAIPRKITNMTNPQLKIFKRAEDLDQTVYCINCQVGNREIEVFLNVDMAGNSSYLLRKLNSVGIVFEAKMSTAKMLIQQLMSILIYNCQSVKILPDEPGWLRNSDGKFEFFGEGDLTWNRAKKMTK